MGMIATADLNAFLDYCVGYYLRALGTSTAAYGIGTLNGAWGAAGYGSSMDALLLAMADTEPIAALISPVRTLRANTVGVSYAGNSLSPAISALQSHIAAQQVANVRTLNDYLTYLNVGLGGTWNALQDPNWRDLYYVFSGSTYPAVYNLYFEVLQGSTYANALGRFVASGAGTGTFTDGFAVDSAKYAGGFPQVRASGLGGSGVITVTGTAYDPAAQATAASKTWTATISGNGVTALAPGGGSPAPTNSLIVDVTDIAIAAGITAGTFYVEGARPSGRPLLP